LLDEREHIRRKEALLPRGLTAGADLEAALLNPFCSGLTQVVRQVFAWELVQVARLAELRHRVHQRREGWTPGYRIADGLNEFDIPSWASDAQQFADHADPALDRHKASDEAGMHKVKGGPYS